MKFFLLTLFLAPFTSTVSAEYVLKKCEWGQTRLTSVQTNLPECMPDTLYHWLPKKYLQWKIDNMNEANFFPMFESEGVRFSLYLWRTPVGSHGYGDTSIRVKLRAGVNFRVVPQDLKSRCHLLAQSADIRTTVFVAWQKWGKNHLSEFMICDQNVIESWSYGTQEHLREIKNEVLWIESHDKEDFDSYVTNTIPWEVGGIDGRHFDRNSLEEKMTKTFFGLGERRVCNPQLLELCDDHFETIKPAYWR